MSRMWWHGDERDIKVFADHIAAHPGITAWQVRIDLRKYQMYGTMSANQIIRLLLTRGTIQGKKGPSNRVYLFKKDGK